MGRVSGGRRRVVGAGSAGGDGSQAHGTRDGRRTSGQQHWPEGSHADPDAARERYNLDVRASHSAMRNLFRVELPVAHWGLVIVVIASVFVGVVWSPRTGAIIGGAFAALFVAALCGALPAGSRGRDAVRAAYKFTFGWANWV